MTSNARPDVVELLWGDRPPPRRGPRRTLSTEVIARAAVELADAEGLGAVTMQRVADAVGVTKMALYRYVPGKDELVALMVDAGLAAPPDLGDTPGGWRPRLDAWARRMFELFLRHPWVMDATVGPRVQGPNEIGWLEQAVAALDGTGLAGAERLDVAVLLIGHVRHIAQQVGGSDHSEKNADAALVAVLAERADRFPAVAAAVRSAAQGTAQDQALDFGLARILDGVQHLVDARA